MTWSRSLTSQEVEPPSFIQGSFISLFPTSDGGENLWVLFLRYNYTHGAFYSGQVQGHHAWSCLCHLPRGSSRTAFGPALSLENSGN